MIHFKAKFKLFFLPFLFTGFGIVAVYTFLHWLLFIQFQVFDWEDEYVEFIIPIITAPFLLGALLYRRFRMLRVINAKKRAPTTFLIMVGCFSVCAPMVISQKYMVAATGKLTSLDSMSELHYVPPTKYYTVRQFYPSKRLLHYKIITYVSGKNNTDLNFVDYNAVPVFDHIYPDTSRIAAMRNDVNPKTLVLINDTLSNMSVLKKLPADSVWMMRYINPSMVMPKYADAGKYGALAVVTRSYKFKNPLPITKIEPAAWLVFKYRESISNNLPFVEKKARLMQFAKHCDTMFRNVQLTNFVYLARLPNNKNDISAYDKAINSHNDVVEGEQIMLSPVYESFENRNGNRLALIIGIFTIGSALFLLILQGFFRVRYNDGLKAGVFKKDELDIGEERTV